MLPLLLLLATTSGATPSIVLEPNPGSARRLQPRRVTASSFLKNGWNRFEQNYLPPYAADDDPATAWVEGVPGKGEGESLLWMGPRLKAARLFRVFVRSGYQKSARLFAANARPRKVRLEPLVDSEAGLVAAGAPLEVVLADQLGWQELVVPTQPAVTGVRLTLLSVYPGKAYEDTCLSDLRVYVEGADPYREDLESMAREEVRRFVLERKQAAARDESKGAVDFAAEYARTATWQKFFGDKDEAASSLDGALELFKDQAEFAPVLARARKLLEQFQELPVSQVKFVPLHSSAETASVALASMESLDFAQTLFATHLGNIGLFEMQAPDANAPDKANDTGGATRSGTEAFISGLIKRPTALLLTDTLIVGEGREDDDHVTEERERLLIFDREVAVAVGIRVARSTELEIHIPEWQPLPNGRVHLAAVHVLQLGRNYVKGTVYREKT